MPQYCAHTIDDAENGAYSKTFLRRENADLGHSA